MEYDWASIWKYKALFINGWLTTIAISFISLLLSLIIGITVALIRRSSIAFFRGLAMVYIEIIRGTPLLVQLLFFFYVVAHSLGMESRYFIGILTLSIFSGAYIAEMIRSGIEGIRASQIESARAIGLSKIQIYRFIIFPQAIRQLLPPLSGQFASIIKDSSLLSIIGISELTYSAQQVNSATYSTLESFLPLAVGYLILTLPISLLTRYIERQFQYEA
jgi:polar amino acid transport system permease protein